MEILLYECHRENEFVFPHTHSVFILSSALHDIVYERHAVDYTDHGGSEFQL